MEARNTKASLAWTFLYIMVCCSRISLAQIEDLRPQKLPVSTNDRDEITLVVTLLNQAICSDDKYDFTRLFTDGAAASQLLENGKSHNIPTGVLPTKIDIVENQATVMCSFRYSDKAKDQNFEMHLRKASGRWRIKISKALEADLTRILLSKNRGGSAKSGREPGAMSPRSLVTLSATPNSLISIRHPYTPISYNIFLINQSIAQQYIQRNLFCQGALLSHESVWFSDNNYDVGFTLDNFWNRIVFGRSHPSDNWIRSYGDHPGEYRFDDPRALTIDAFDTIYVADKGNRKLVKLFFNRNTRLISYVCSFSVPGILRPVDISFDQGFSECNPNDGDGIWIADDITYRIVKVNRAGQVVTVIESYSDGGSTYRLQPTQVVCSPFGFGSSLLGVVDQARNTFIFLNGSSVVNLTAPAIRSTLFEPSTSLLSCVGFDYFGQFWVGDARSLQYHIFSDDGKYLASTTTGLFASPTGITRAQHRISAGCASIYADLSVVTSDRWGQNSGMRIFYPGADAVNLSASKFGSTFVFKWTTTNRSYTTAQILNSSNQVVYTLASYRVELGNYYQEYCSVSALPYGSLKLRVTSEPYFNISEYQPRGYAVTPRVQEISFNNLAPVSVSLSGPGSLTVGQQGTFNFSISGGLPPYTYGWYKMTQCCSSAMTANGDSSKLNPDAPPACGAYEDLPGWENSPTASISGLYNFTVKVRGHDAAGQWFERTVFTDVGRCYPNSGGGGGCPFVFTWNGSRFVEDNNILPQSESAANVGGDVIDRYKLMQPLVPRENQYVLQIREYENERSYLDNVQLVAVDYPQSKEVMMTENGEVVAYSKPFAIKRAKLRGRSVLRELRDFDSLTVGASAGDILSFGFSRNSSNSNAVLSDSPFAPGEETVIEGAGSTGIIIVKDRPLMLVHNSPTDILMPLQSLYLRRNPSLVAALVTVQDTSNLQLVWSDSAMLDYINLATRVSSDVSVYPLPLLRAIHDGYGPVTQQLSESDSVYTELTPVHSIELQFKTPQQSVPHGKRRSFFLVSKGRYEHGDDSQENILSKANAPQNGQELLPKELALQQNFPNPFNPSTSMRVDLPQAEKMSLIVYDVLGKQIAILCNGIMPAGYHSVTWHGTNMQGNPVSSGIYFVKLQIDTERDGVKFRAVKKLLLTK